MNRFSRYMVIIMLVTTAGFFNSNAAAQENDAATVGDWIITKSRVDRHLANTLGSRELDPKLLERARAEALEHLIRRQIVFEFVKKQCPVPDSEVTSELSILEANLRKTDQKIEDHLEKTGLSKEELKQEIRWRVAWQEYLDRKITDDAMKSYFDRNRRIFDGTEIRVAHIVFAKTDAEEQIKLANQVRKEIGEGRISWDEAVKKNSIASSSKNNGGEIGWIRFRDPMPDVFSDAAFKLEQGQISSPVETAVGVHLIKCLEIKAGTISMKDRVKPLRIHMTRFLFDRIARNHRGELDIKYAKK